MTGSYEASTKTSLNCPRAGDLNKSIEAIPIVLLDVPNLYASGVDTALRLSVGCGLACHRALYSQMPASLQSLRNAD